MVTFLLYTLATIVVIAVIPAAIAVGVYSFRRIPDGLGFIKDKLDSRNRDSLDIEIEDKMEGIRWLKEKKEKIIQLQQLDAKEKALKKEIDEYAESNQLLEEDEYNDQKEANTYLL